METCCTFSYSVTSSSEVPAVPSLSSSSSVRAVGLSPSPLLSLYQPNGLMFGFVPGGVWPLRNLGLLSLGAHPWSHGSIGCLNSLFLLGPPPLELRGVALPSLSWMFGVGNFIGDGFFFFVSGE